MLRRFRFVAILMIIATLTCRIGIVNVNAAQGVQTENAKTELSGLRITDLDKPVPGKTLDFKARVRTNENVTWEIPVIWIDDLGNTAYEAVPGRTYYPSFAFYLPAGYTINTKATGSQLGVRLPDFLVELFGSSVAFVGDAEKGITYITYAPAYIAANQSASAATAKTAIAPAASVYPVNSTVQNASGIDPYSDRKDDDKEEAKPSDRSSSSADIVPYDPYKQVRIHCSKDVIRLMGEEVLNELISLVKNKLEPQAVNLLKNSFETYSAHTSELGKQIGLYVYYRSGSVSDGTGETYDAPADALAYVSGIYSADLTGAQVYKYIIGLDTSSFMEQNPETGKWVMKESEKDAFDNTIVHELMHAFMDDYTRFGMMDADDSYPGWFTEGIASAVENVYQFRAYLFQSLGDVSQYEYNERSQRFLPKDSETDYRIPYSDNSIRTKYVDESLQGSYRYDLSYSGQPDNTGSAYVSGYLAVVYLGYLAAARDGITGIVTAPDYDRGIYPSIDIDAIRYGTGRILDLLHEGYSLDQVISHISLRPGEDAGSYYDTTDAFQAAFIQGDDEESNMRTIVSGENGTSENILGSLTFCNYFLNYLEANSSENGDNSCLANGSILRADQNYTTPLDRTVTASSDLYRIVDSSEFTASTVTTDVGGGKSTSNLNAEAGDNDPEQGAAVAAKPVDVTIPDENASDTASDIVASEPAPSDEGSTPAPTTPDMEESPAIPVIPDVIEPVPATPAEPEMPAPVPVEDPEFIPDQVVSEGEQCTILPHDEDAMVPEYDEAVAEPSSEPDSDGGNDGGSDDSGNDDGGNDGGGDDAGDAADDSGDSGE